ncbi:hypothetical protein O9H85_08505 [Paenibacillus filicis]|uniref:Uncharacterized protein n=1 Tax=Paenibacillus gyeongsangnamensis TaxID=3388067 RepID=A0ABT4Q6M6_9BACL|nr:hypothetical protein [Paenibacillus filicis]MCZ8512473.1 hypothetical protein [Paenibacillus filicis]
MAKVKAVPQPDLVLISWTRNPLIPGSARRIITSRVIGSASPCTTLLASGRLLIVALNCLLRNGFFIVVSRKTSSISGFILLQRNH